MADPVAPNIPADAPQDVKDFFDCKGDKLVWKKGKVTWLGLGIDPDVSFEHGKEKGTIDITINFGFGISFTLNASVNAAGELTVDTSKIPDLSKVSDKLPGKKDVDNSIKNINDWFKKNGKKLKGATFKRGEVTLEKTATTGAYAPPIVPLDEDEDGNKAQNVGLTPGWTTDPTTEEWDSAVALTAVPMAEVSSSPSRPGSIFGPVLLLVILGLVALGLATGYVLFGGAPVATNGPIAAASPTTVPTTSQSPSPSPSPTRVAVVTASPSPLVPTEVTTIDEFLQSVGVEETLRTQLAALTTSDETSDWNEQDAVLDPAEVDIVSALTFEAVLGPGFLGQFPPCAEGLICASDATGVPGTIIGAPGEYYVYLMQSRGPILGVPTKDTGYFEMGVVNFDFTPAGGGDPVAFDRGPRNFLTGSNTAYSLRWALPAEEFSGAMFRLVHGEDDAFFHGEDSTAFGVVRGNVVAVFVPETEWDGAADFRLYSYYQSETAGAVSDTAPNMTEPMTLYDPATVMTVDLP
jgi:hypothetical protein